MQRISQLRFFPTTKSCFLDAIIPSNRGCVSSSALSYYTSKIQNAVEYFQHENKALNENDSRNRLISAIDQICLETKFNFADSPVLMNKERFKSISQLNNLTARLATFKINDEQSIELLETVLPQMLELLPNALQSQKVILFNVLASKNIRQMDFIQALSQSLCSSNQYLLLDELTIVVSAIASLTFYDTQLNSVLKSNFFHHLNLLKHSNKSFTQIIRSFSKLKITDEKLWAAIVDLVLRIQNENLIFKDVSIILTACCTANIPNIEQLLPCIKKIDKMVLPSMSPSLLLTIAHSLASANFFLPKLSSLLLKKTFIDSLTRDMEIGESSKITSYYNVMRLFNIATAIKMKISEAKLNQVDQLFLNNLYSFNPVKNLIDAPEKENILWQLKYTMDMTVVNQFRQLLQSVVPLKTHLSSPYVHKSNGTLIEGDVIVSNKQIVPLEMVTKTSNLTNNAPTRVAVLFFTKNHTTLPDKNFPKHLAKVRLLGISQMAVRFLQKDKESNCFPVVFTELELEALENDEQRKALILERITSLSTKYHKI